jgi:DNA-directed RNA polymerase II subunit RPB1
MSIYKELSYDQDIEVVQGVQFSVLGPNEIIQRSVVEVVKTDTYAGNEPVIGGLFDPRMGVLEHNRYCSTCQQKNIFCPGHFGHIVLARPVFHPMFFETVRKLLKCVCYRCSRPIVSSRSEDFKSETYKTEIRKIAAMKNPKKRWDAYVKLCSVTKLKKCGDDQESGENNSGCQAIQPTRYLKESSMKITAEWKEIGEKVEMTAEDILRIFKRISDADIELMGFNPQWNTPEWMICSVLPVPPPAVRPSIIEENGQRREDDLTHKLSDIVKYNIQLKQRIDSNKGTEEQLKVLTNLIQYHIATFMDNTIPGLPVAQQRNGRKLKSIADRLKKKEGRIRGNLNGKRVDQSARSVITPDPFISLDELGVPIRIAMNLTFPETVNEYNIEELKNLVRNGPNEWPGAKYVCKRNDGVTYSCQKYMKNRDKFADELAEVAGKFRHRRAMA